VQDAGATGPHWAELVGLLWLWGPPSTLKAKGRMANRWLACSLNLLSQSPMRLKRTVLLCIPTVLSGIQWGWALGGAMYEGDSGTSALRIVLEHLGRSSSHTGLHLPVAS
jgi:hypothetical protein